jgi:hypothetical protein
MSTFARQEDRTMADDKSKRGPQDAKLISLSDDLKSE